MPVPPEMNFFNKGGQVFIIEKEFRGYLEKLQW